MNQVSSRFETVTHALAPSVPLSLSVEFNERLTALYALSQRSRHVFASPLGPFYQQAHHYHLPRFVYFGPHTSDESLRLAFYAGFDASDLRGTLAMLHFVERLARTPDLGQGLNLSFFPAADVTGLLHGDTRDLASASWSYPTFPEIDLLAKDARGRGYHGFVRIETTADDDDVVGIRLRGQAAEAIGVELISSEDVVPWPVRWEAEPVSAVVTDGPLSLVDDLPLQPFELTLRVPVAWSHELHREAVTSILKGFILRYRGFHAYGQNL
ncbi:MAG: hypothetical protein JF599_01475 [Verrucomicrobia bacterium]|nr:hypothetical protein [Verrucomicrobiota bacterium]